VMSQDGRAV